MWDIRDRFRAMAALTALLWGLSIGKADEKPLLKPRREWKAVGFTPESLTPDGKTLISGSLRMDLATGKVHAPAWGRDAERARMSPDGKSVAVRYPKGQFKIIDLTTDKEVFAFSAKNPKRGSGEPALHIDPAGKQVAVGCESSAGLNVVELWDLTARRHRFTLNLAGGGRYETLFRCDGRQLTTILLEQQITLWDGSTGKKTAEIKTSASCDSVVYSPDGKRLAAWATDDGFADERDGGIHVWDTATGKRLGKFKRPVNSKGGESDHGLVRFSPDGKTLAAMPHDGDIVLMDRESGKPLKQLKGFGADAIALPGLVYSPNGKVLVAVVRVGGKVPDPDGPGNVLWSGEIKAWDVATGKALASIRVPDRVWAFVAFAPDGRTLITADVPVRVKDDKRTSVKLWDLPPVKK